MLQEIKIVLAAVQEHQAVLQHLVIRHLFPKKSPPRFHDHIFFDVREDLRHQLANDAQHVSPRRLHLRKPRLDHVRLLAALEIFPALPDVLLHVQNHVAELIHKFRGQKFQQRQPEQQVNLNVFLLLRLAQRTLQQFRQQFAKACGINRLGIAEFDAGKIGAAGILPDQVKQVIARHLHEFWAKKNVVVNVVHANGQ